VSIGIFQILFIALVVLVLFGRGRISETLGDVGKGIKSFRAGVIDDGRDLPTAIVEAETVPADKTSR
jgi:sec-independent protein translocase protein TatA